MKKENKNCKSNWKNILKFAFNSLINALLSWVVTSVSKRYFSINESDKLFWELSVVNFTFFSFLSITVNYIWINNNTNIVNKNKSFNFSGNDNKIKIDSSFNDDEKYTSKDPNRESITSPIVKIKK
ncbi:MAG: hypothetical protein GBAus27B_000207 [Mycoplasmataceae bacterium]|nr:MAG: hypothetical protein GBAus27B_000207 [Mycoplasmataceae bacterium]